MGRLKASKMTGKFYLRKDRGADRNGKCAIYLDYTLGQRHARVETGEWIEEKFWDRQKRMVSNKHPQCARLTQKLELKRRKIDDAIYDYSMSHKYVTIEELRDIVQEKTLNKVNNNTDFVDYAIETIENEYKMDKIGISVRDNALCSLRMFRKYLLEKNGESGLSVSELSVEIVIRYIVWRQGHGNTNATINHALTPIIKAARRGVIDKLVDASIANGISQLRPRIKKNFDDDDEDREVHYLTEEQMKQFVALRDTVKYDRTRDYIDMFLFSLHACGLRVSDIITLEWKHIDLEKKTLRKILYKGDKFHEMSLTDGALEILRRWHKRTGKSRFVFGLLGDDCDLRNKSERKRLRLNKNRAILESLKTLGDKMNLPFNLTMHVARHTFAVWALNRGVDVHVISELMGHSSVTVTEQVYAKFMPSTLEREVQEKLNFKIT